MGTISESEHKGILFLPTRQPWKPDQHPLALLVKFSIFDISIISSVVRRTVSEPYFFSHHLPLQDKRPRLPSPWSESRWPLWMRRGLGFSPSLTQPCVVHGWRVTRSSRGPAAIGPRADGQGRQSRRRSQRGCAATPLLPPPLPPGSRTRSPPGEGTATSPGITSQSSAPTGKATPV